MARNKKTIDDKISSKFANNLKELMSRPTKDKPKGTTQDDLAQAIGKTRQTVSQYVNGISEPGYDTLVTIANYFNTTTDYLLGRTNDPYPTPSAVDDLGITAKNVSWIKNLNRHDMYAGYLDTLNSVLGTLPFQKMVVSIHDYISAHQARWIYSHVFDSMFTDASKFFSDPDAPTMFKQRITEIADSNEYDAQINMFLRTMIADYEDLILTDNFDISDIYAYTASKHLSSMLEVLKYSAQKKFPQSGNSEE